jgi:hypothetical protein
MVRTGRRMECWVLAYFRQIYKPMVDVGPQGPRHFPHSDSAELEDCRRGGVPSECTTRQCVSNHRGRAGRFVLGVRHMTDSKSNIKEDTTVISAAQSWTPAGPDIESVLAQYPDPLLALSEARIPAIILRRVYDPAQCVGLIRRFIDRGLMPDPDEHARAADPRTRIDLGTSLGNLGADKEVFLQHAVGTRELFRTLFDGFDDPVKTIYDALTRLAVGKQVQVAREPDGRLYGPAIFRIHYGGHTYKPHIDHVVLREKRFDYAVSRFQHQFAGVLCFQNATHDGRSTQAVLHQCLWTPEVQPHIEEGTFHTYAAERGIGHYRVDLEQGDLYFFNTRCIHEVPGVQGRDPRIVLATFIGYSPDDEQVAVWS